MEKPSTARLALKWGIIASVLLSIYTVVIYMTGFFKIGPMSFLSYFILLIAIILAAREFRSLNNNYMSFGECLGLGTLLSAVTGVITSIFTYVYINMIDTTLMQQMEDLQREQMEARGLTEEQISQALEMAAIFTRPSVMFLMGLFIYVLIGFVWSLIVSAVLKKDKPEMNF